ncbi:hypothetical protein HPB49_006664 [Dermacentor silvarum]|uniref:Uncharacterized protein n=1 Tax=Dermacentor silvarum TaxID=543639 RepID=A0ACB8DBI2_DERSI|nr:hypothetical protein HPB49_006664 [Dermacentor silvarum]
MRPCLLYNASDHTVQECSTSLTSEEKRRKLQPRRRCFLCAKCNHSRAIKAYEQRVRAVRETRKQAGIHRQTTASNIRFYEYYRTHVLIPTDWRSLGLSVTLRTLHSTNELTIDAIEVPEISAVTSPPADGAIITLRTHYSLVPAHARSEATTFREDKISILIGSDLYWEVVTGQITRLSPQVTAVEALFGCTIQGTLHDLFKGSAVQTTSLFLAVGEPAANDASIDVDISSLWRIDTL